MLAAILAIILCSILGLRVRAYLLRRRLGDLGTRQSRLDVAESEFFRRQLELLDRMERVPARLASVDPDDEITGVHITTPQAVESEKGWMQTYSGRRFYPLAPTADDIELADIAHGLAMTCRYGGHSRHFYSVAEHCVLVSKCVEEWAIGSGLSPQLVRAWALEGLLHDSAEAYIGDMIRPLKHQPEMLEFRKAEAAIERAVFQRFAINSSDQSSAAVKAIDDRILVDEIRSLMPAPEMYGVWVGELAPLGVEISGWSPANAERAFMVRYRELTIRETVRV